VTPKNLRYELHSEKGRICKRKNMSPIIISIDDLKSAFASYTPAKASQYHSASAKLADKAFEDELKKLKHGEVILLCGGSASGKTEFVSEYLTDFKGIIFDSTLSTSEGAKIKIKKIIKQQKKPIIYFVFPHDIKNAFAAFQGRERKIPKHRFFETHIGSRKTMLWVAENYPEIEIQLYKSIYSDDSNDLKYERMGRIKRKEIMDFFTSIQYSDSELNEIIS
jgi:hypothetical protein